MSLLVALDLETKSLTSSPEHALYPHLSTITCVGIWCPEFECVFRNLSDLQDFISSNNLLFVGHNFQFDLKHLTHHGIKIPLDQWSYDTKIMAGLLNQKIPEDWLKKYDAQRKEENKRLPKGVSHRQGSPHSLKTLAPFFLGVKPFWEDPNDHDSDEYVLKDCEYTYKLYSKLKGLLKEEELLDFYHNRSHEWARMMTAASIKGINLDMQRLQEMEEKTVGATADLKAKLDEEWKDAYDYLYQKNKEDLKKKYKTEKGYLNAINKIEKKANLNSPAQLLTILRDYFKYDIQDFKGKESTGKEVLQKLAEKHEDIKLFYEYRKNEKLLTAFFPTYRELQNQGVLNPFFNIEGTRTGRISSSSPNAQQVAGSLHELFVARPGHKLITRDLSAIEPRMCAFITEDPMLCSLMINGGDFHSENARIMFNLKCVQEEVKDKHPYERKVAKEVGLALLYGAGARRIQQSAQKYGFQWTLKKCKQIHQRFKETYETAFSYKNILDSMAEAGEPIKTPFGRIHFYPDPEDIYMKAFNTLIQSSASDLLLDSQLKASRKYREAGLDAHLLLVVHDECVTEAADNCVEEVEKIIEGTMTGYELKTKYGNIPLFVEGTTGREWSK